MAASYVISVLQASALPEASFSFHLALDTLAVMDNDSPCLVRSGLGKRHGRS
jgi:hypothetical protein